MDNYVSSVKAAHVDAGFVWDDRLRLHAKACTRAVSRGQGSGRQSGPSVREPIPGLHALRGDVWLGDDDPVNPEGVVLLGSFWLLR